MEKLGFYSWQKPSFLTTVGETLLRCSTC